MNRILLFFFISFLLFWGCQTTGDQAPASSSKTGETLAKIHCATCHQYPDPSLLDKASWEKQILPRMANMMGFYNSPNQRAQLIDPNTPANLYPSEPLLEKTDWEAIKQFYLSQAPKEIIPPVPDIPIGLKGFKVIQPAFKISPPSTTLVKFMQDQSIFVGDALSKKLVQFDKNLNLLKSGNILEGAVHLRESEDGYWILSMGSFSPTDQASGMLLHLPKSENKKARIIADQLKRPVHAAYGDLDQDGRTDIVLCEFGKWAGQLNILYNKGNQEFVPRSLVQQTGASKTFLRDFNQDGRLDIMVLFAQGQEGISLFYNQGKGQFSREVLLSFSPSHGSTNMELVDLENDGDWDIVYTAGDNADFNPILKPYHGVYVFENNGTNKYTQKYFYPLHGANGVKIVDFDLDGDLDMAAISFFPDFAKGAKESFVYLENQGDFSFVASTFENNSQGRWIVLDANDKDGDGDVDLILGALTFEVIPDLGYTDRWIEKGLPFIVLENLVR